MRDLIGNYITKIDHFLCNFFTRYNWISQTKNILWWWAWKNEKNVHLRFVIFETSLDISLQNKFRDFQKWWIYEKYENCPFYRLFFGHMWLDMTNKNYLMTISMEKWRKCTSHIFHFGNFVTEICAKHTERFLKSIKLWKIPKFKFL